MVGYDLIIHNKFVESYYFVVLHRALEIFSFVLLLWSAFSPAAGASSANALTGWMVTANPLSSPQSAVTAALSLPVQYNQG